MRQKIKSRMAVLLRRWKTRGMLLVVLAVSIMAAVLVWAGASQLIGHKYVLTDGAQSVTVTLYPGTVDEACQKAGFDDKIVRSQYESGGITYLTLGDMLYAEIQRGNETIRVPFSPCTVAELLEANNITLTEDENVTPSLTSYLSADAKIVIDSVTYETVTEIEEIAYGILVRESDTLEKGQR